MPSKALVTFIAAISFCVVSSKPTVSRGSDGNGNVGFKYDVSHYPGNSHMHMNIGGANRYNHQAPHNPYHDTKKHEEGGFILNSPPPSEYRPNHYTNAEKPPIGHLSHGPEIIHEPQPQYPSPYDSASKNHYNDNDGEPYITNDAHPSSIHSSSIPYEKSAYVHHPNKDLHAPETYPEEYRNRPATQEHINPHVLQENINGPISQEYINPSVSRKNGNSHISQEPMNPHISQEYINPPVSQENIESPVSQEYIESPVLNEYVPLVSKELVNSHSPQEPVYPVVSQEHVNSHIPQEPISPHLSQEYINPPVSQEYVNPPVAQKHVNPHIPQEPIYPPVHQEQINPHTSQDHIDPPLSQEYVNLPVSKKNVVPHQEPAAISVEYPNSPIKQDYIDAPKSQDSINPHISQEYIGNPDTPHQNIVPSIKQAYPPPSKSIVEPEPLEQVSVPIYDEPNKISEPVPGAPKYQFVPSGPPYVTNSHSTQIIHPPLPDSHNTDPYEGSIHNSSPIVDDKPSSISHAFRLPIPALSPASSGLHVDQTVPENHSSLPVAPISHSTRLLIPNSAPSEETDVADLLPKSQLDVKSPGSFQNTAGELTPFAPFPQPAELKSLQIEAEESGTAPGSVEAVHGQSNEAPVLPPVSHAFRLNLPGVIPSLQLPPSPNPEVNPVEAKVSSALDEASLASSADVPHSPRISHAFRLNLPSSQNHK